MDFFRNVFSSYLYKGSLGQLKSRILLCFRTQVLVGPNLGARGQCVGWSVCVLYCGLVSGLVRGWTGVRGQGRGLGCRLGTVLRFASRSMGRGPGCGWGAVGRGPCYGLGSWACLRAGLLVALWAVL